MTRGFLLPFASLASLTLVIAAVGGACSRAPQSEDPPPVVEAPMPMVPPLPPPPTGNHDRPGDLPPAALVELGLKDVAVDAGMPAADAGIVDAGSEAGADGLGSTAFRVGRRGARVPVAAVGCDAPGGNDSDCPLRTWMRENATKAILAKDFGALEQAFTTIATMAPSEGYPNWTSIAKDGAAATHVLHLDAVKATCRSCHQQYRETYKKERRSTPLPNLAVR